eukprot:NODE_616_length_5370_cov_0.348131.p1 type:complete len:340 gc:universal NODE_616_length_5370_cov_0.348131:3931-2912(-)
MIYWEFNYFLRNKYTLIIEHPKYHKIVPLKLFYSYARCSQDNFQFNEKVLIKVVKYTDIRQEPLPFKSLLKRRLPKPDLTEFIPQYLIEEVVGQTSIDLMGLFDSMLMGKITIDANNYVEYVASVQEPLEISNDKILIKCAFESLNIDQSIVLKVILNEECRQLNLKTFNRTACFLVPKQIPVNDISCQLFFKDNLISKVDLKNKTGRQSKHLIPESTRFSLDLLKKDVVLDVKITSSVEPDFDQFEEIDSIKSIEKPKLLKTIMDKGKNHSFVEKQEKKRPRLPSFQESDKTKTISKQLESEISTLTTNKSKKMKYKVTLPVLKPRPKLNPTEIPRWR